MKLKTFEDKALAFEVEHKGYFIFGVFLENDCIDKGAIITILPFFDWNRIGFLRFKKREFKCNSCLIYYKI